MKSPHVIWASVVIIFILIAGSVSLVLADKDVSTILTLAAIVALPVLTALGVANVLKTQEVKDIANGNTVKLASEARDDRDQLLTMVKDLQSTVTGLALQVQPPPEKKSEDDYA